MPWLRVLSAAAPLVVFAHALHAQSPTTLALSIVQPKPIITAADVITVRANTLMDVFPSSAYRTDSVIFGNGSTINWFIQTAPRGGIGLTVLLPLGALKTLGPLPVGTYELNANWSHVGGGLLQNAPSSGSGRLTFSVLPAGAGDFDGDGAVAGADLLAWQRELGSDGPMSAGGNGDQEVDAEDLAVWRGRFGSTSTTAGQAAAAALGVPEPTGVSLIVAAALWLGVRRRSSKRRS